ncbi:MAG: hypothetical protein KBI08_10825 [Sphingobium sp.]|nr:hypothetical protein [Sphingobium sp.]MBP9158991.1 hypothetical protein [Sphingobium sp.]
MRPLQNECFDSWLHRLVARHDTTRKALFIHLGGDPRLASYDLARGKAGVPAHLHAAFDRLIAQLGWAVEIEPEMVVATFVSLPTHWLLPPALRRFGCAACWREALAQNKPLCVSKEWILCASWWCHDHGLPLSFMPESDAGSRSDASVRKLAKLEVAARELARSIRPTKRLIAANKDAMTFLLEGDDGMFPRRQRAYFECMVANGFHLSSVRIQLMALRHSRGAEPARRFEQFVAIRRNELHRAGRRFFRTRQPPVEWIDTEFSVYGQKLVTVSRWQHDLVDLLTGYLVVALRAEARGAPLGRPKQIHDPLDSRYYRYDGFAGDRGPGDHDSYDFYDFASEGVTLPAR